MDVTKENFNNKLPDIIKSISNATFVSIDTEFTGIVTDPSVKNTYFDSGASLYEKKRNSLNNISILQFGLSAFRGCKDENNYDVTTFNFYIRPHNILSIDPTILCQVSGLEFLQTHQFNFNKWLYEGISCLNDEDEDELRKFYSNLLEGKSNITIPYEIMDILDKVQLWVDDIKGNDSMDVDIMDYSSVLIFIAIVHQRFASVLASLDLKKITLSKVDKSAQAKLASHEALRALDLIISELKGFTKVFDCLSKSEVPLVLHNGLTDLLLMHKQFYRNLPKKFGEFLSNINELFPIIYDTKELAHKLYTISKSTDKHDLDFLNKTSLPSVKQNLEKEMIVYFRPSLTHNELTKKYDGKESYFHEAGYDAFSCGYCFLQMSHIHIMMQYKDSKLERPLSARELVYSFSAFKNRIPVQQSGVKYISIDGQNQKVEKFNWLIVEPRSRRISLSSSVVSTHLAKFGRVDVMPWYNKSILVATSRKPVSDEIVRTYKGHNELKITRYHAFKHSPAVRTFALSCALISTGISTWLIINTFPKVKFS